RFGRAAVQFCEWHFAVTFLCLCNAVHEYARHREKGNQQLEMADVPIVYYERHCLCFGVGGIPSLKIKRLYYANYIRINNICTCSWLCGKKVYLESFRHQLEKKQARRSFRLWQV